MTYSTLMAHMELGRSNKGLLQIAGDLAERFQSRVIGITTCQPVQINFGDSYASGELFELDREQIKKDIREAEAEFRSTLQARIEILEWRSEVTFEALSDYLAREARNTDLIITGVTTDNTVIPSRRADTGDLVMQAGRPVLIVPAGVDTLKLERVVVAWKDTRESRRSIFDALPLLQMAAHVLVVEIATADELAEARIHLDNVIHWLKRHGVVAEFIVAASTGDDTVQLNTIVHEHNADTIVAGAYGHSRVREWAFGGVTRDLLLHGNHCALVSH